VKDFDHGGLLHVTERETTHVIRFASPGAQNLRSHEYDYVLVKRASLRGQAGTIERPWHHNGLFRAHQTTDHGGECYQPVGGPIPVRHRASDLYDCLMMMSRCGFSLLLVQTSRPWGLTQWGGQPTTHVIVDREVPPRSRVRYASLPTSWIWWAPSTPAQVPVVSSKTQFIHSCARCGASSHDSPRRPGPPPSSVSNSGITTTTVPLAAHWPWPSRRGGMHARNQLLCECNGVNTGHWLAARPPLQKIQ